MSLKNLFCIILIILICFVAYNIFNHQNIETYDSNDIGRCYTGCRDRETSSLTDVCPEKPECLGICINQHTYTEENIVDEPLKSREDIGSLKSGQSQSDVISTNCGLCISISENGLRKMNDLGTQCSQN